MNDEIKEFIEFRADEDGAYFYYIDKNGDEQWSYNLDNLKDYITNLQKENEEIKVENEKLTQLWLNSQEKRRKAIEYLEQPYRDNFDYSKAELLNILQNGSEKNDKN